MQCQNCQNRPAAIQLTQIVNNSVTTVHLCEQCAAEKGIETPASVAKYPLSDFLASMGQGAIGQLPPGDDRRQCTYCQATLQDFREVGRLGCPECYESFRVQLRDLLRRLHGSSQHVGEQYGNALDPPKNQSSLRDLRKQLQRAIEAEQFELAAELRDQIRILE